MKQIYRMIVLISSITFLSCIIILGVKTYHTAKNIQMYKKMSSRMRTDSIKTSEFVDYKKQKLESYAHYYQQNSDMIGWIFIDGTQIDYPVMQKKENNEFYLRKNFNQEYSFIGTPFLDVRSHLNPASDNWLIYAHNTMDHQMFSDLLYYRDYSFYLKHPIIEFDLVDELQKFEIMAVFDSQVYDKQEEVFKYYYFFDAQNEEEYKNYVDNVKRLSIYDTQVEAEYGDQLLTLSTCRYEIDKGRFVVVAKKIQE